VIDEYLADCKEQNVEPELPYKGTFNVSISPELHRNIAVYAIEHGKSLNAAVEEAIGNIVKA
jgi:predicted HicB family RNase H-like nuclease